MDNEKALSSLVNGIFKAFDIKSKKLAYDKTYDGRIKTVNSDGTYDVIINNITYERIKTKGGTCVVNEIVDVLAPQNNFNNIKINKKGTVNNISISTDDPSGGSNGDIWIKYVE